MCSEEPPLSGCVTCSNFVQTEGHC
uniref:Uncharacterized protein n=1 Tax=Anguilla anguilla TaxID=7936 RepID=A0A0E9RJK6_ANGAN